MSDIEEIKSHRDRAQAAYDSLPLSGPVTSWCEMYGEDLLDSCTKLLAAEPPLGEAAAAEIERLRATIAAMNTAAASLVGGCACRFDEQDNPIKECSLHAEMGRSHRRIACELVEACEAADVRPEEEETLVRNIYMLVEHRHELARQNAKLMERVAEVEKQRDAAFALSECECGPEEACANLVAAQTRVAELEDAQKWRPIWTAPRDGTPVLVYWALRFKASRSQIECAACIRGEWTDADGRDELWRAPDLWRPLPAPPSDGT